MQHMRRAGLHGRGASCVRWRPGWRDRGPGLYQIRGRCWTIS